MTHHPRRADTPGPRRLQRLQEYRERLFVLRSRVLEATAAGRDRPDSTPHATILAARAATATSARDKAERLKGGDGDTYKLSPIARLANYRRQNYWRDRDALSRGGPITIAQARQVRRNATRAELVEIVSRGVASTAELRTYPITEAERGAWLERVGA
jgi:hypothetical protein